MRVAVYSSERDNRPQARDLPWVLLAKVLTAFREGPCSASDCIGKKCPHKSGSAWSPADYAEGAARGNRNVRAITALVYDLDHVVSEEWEAHLQAAGFAYAVHSTHTNREDDTSLRLIIPLSRPLTPAEHRPVWSAVIAQFGLPADTVCGDPARLYYLPSSPVGAPRISATHAGLALDVDRMIAALPAVAPVSAPPERPLDTPSERPPASPATIQAALRRLLAHGPAIEGSGGDKHTLTAACIARNDFALSEAEALDVLEIWNRANVPPWDRADLETKITNAQRYSSGETGAARAASETKTMLLGSAPTSALGLPPPEPPPEPGSWADLLGRALRLVREKLSNSEEAGRVDAGPMFQSAHDLMRAEHKPPAWLVRDLITVGGLAVISTEPKAAKTWAATELSIAVSTGTDAFGCFLTLAGRVAYFYAEDLGASVANRLRALSKRRPADKRDLSNLYAQPRGRDLDVTDDEQLANLIASVWSIGGVTLLVLDPLRDIHSAEEDSSDQMALVMRRLRFLSAELACTVLFVHHSKKLGPDAKNLRGGQAMRGSSAVHGSVDSAMYFKENKIEGSTVFTSVIESEVKAAAGAGKFSLTLKIEDDPTTSTAVDAEWIVQRNIGEARAATKQAEKNATLDELDQSVLESVRSHPANVAQLAARLNIGSHNARNALLRLEEAGLVRLEDTVSARGRQATHYVHASKPAPTAAPVVPGSPASKFVKE